MRALASPAHPASPHLYLCKRNPFDGRKNIMRRRCHTQVPDAACKECMRMPCNLTLAVCMPYKTTTNCRVRAADARRQHPARICVGMGGQRTAPNTMKTTRRVLLKPAQHSATQPCATDTVDCRVPTAHRTKTAPGHPTRRHPSARNPRRSPQRLPPLQPKRYGHKW